MVAEWSRDGPEMVTGLTRFTHDIMCMLLRLIWKWIVIKFRCKGKAYFLYEQRYESQFRYKLKATETKRR